MDDTPQFALPAGKRDNAPVVAVTTRRYVSPSLGVYASVTSWTITPGGGLSRWR